MVVTNPSMFSRSRCIAALMVAIFCSLFSVTSKAAVLPEDHIDILYHKYEGGGMTIDGPSILVRKQFKDTVSIWGNYYVDMLSSASIDVMTQGSPYTEERIETSVGMDYLHDRTTLSFSHTNSSEEDYEANTYGFGLSQEFFGDMSTLSLNYSKGQDEVRRNLRDEGEIVETTKVGDATHQRFSIGFTQVLTRKWIVSLNAEAVVDEGFLNNPYRSVRYLDNSGNQLTQLERYPTTRNSDAFAIRSLYYLPWRASARLEYKTFLDSWGIEADIFELRYLHPIGERWLIEAKVRGYSQTAADFYSDLYPFEDAQNFLARDKELSEFTTSTYGLGVTYEIKAPFLSWFDSTTVNLYWDSITFDYVNFLENTEENQIEFGVGTEPAYTFEANVIRFFLSFKY